MFVIAVGGSVLNVIGREEEEPPVFILFLELIHILKQGEIKICPK